MIAVLVIGAAVAAGVIIGTSKLVMIDGDPAVGKVAKVTAVEAKALDAAVRAIGRKAHREAPRMLQRRDLLPAIKGTDRKVTGNDAPFEEAERLGYIVQTEGGWIAGESRPAA